MGQDEQYSGVMNSTGSGIRNWVSSVAGHVAEYTKDISLPSVRRFVRTHPTVFMVLGTVMDGVEGDGRCTSQLVESAKANNQRKVYHTEMGIHERDDSDVYVIGSELLELTNTQKLEAYSAVEDITTNVIFDDGNVSHTYSGQELLFSREMQKSTQIDTAETLRLMEATVEEADLVTSPTSTINSATAGIIRRV